MEQQSVTDTPTSETPTETPVVIAQKRPPVKKCDPVALKTAQDSLSIVTTLLLSPGAGASSPKTFYAHFLMRMNVIWTMEMPTAGVSVTDKINLYVNPEFFNGLNSQQKMELLEHEIEHVVYLHPIRAKDYISVEKNAEGRMKCANVAMDANINEDKPNLVNLAPGIVSIERLNEQLKQMGSKHHLDIKDPWEVHYEKLMDAAKNNPNDDGSGSGFGDPVDDHSKWAESTGNEEVAKGIVRETANKAQQATGVGHMPEHMMREIMEMNKASVNWKRELRQFFVNSLKFDFERTRNRRNRRYGIIQPGRRKKPRLSVAICVDSSGSVYDEAFTQFFAEIDAIYDMGVDITVIDADCGVAAVYKYEPRKPIKRYGSGGTAYIPAITKAKELEVDGIIYAGDMDSSDVPENPGVPFLWAVVGEQNPPADFGKVVRIKVEPRK
jgi:predicted metal-dependent peptidase